MDADDDVPRRVRRCSGLLGFNCVDINLQTVQSIMPKLFRFILGVHGSHEQITSYNIQMLVIKIYNKKRKVNYQSHIVSLLVFSSILHVNSPQLRRCGAWTATAASCGVLLAMWESTAVGCVSRLQGTVSSGLERFTLPAIHTNLPVFERFEDVKSFHETTRMCFFCIVSKVFDGEISFNSFLSVVLHVRGVCHFVSGVRTNGVQENGPS